MYNVSAEYLQTLHKLARFEHCRGTIDGIPFDDDNIISMSYSNKSSNTDDITWGSCYVGQISAQLENVPGVGRGRWRNKIVRVETGLEIDDQGTTEWVPLGVFRIAEATWDDTGLINIVANDYISQLDEEFNGQYIQVQAGTIYDMAVFACNHCGLTFGLTREETAALPNGSVIFTLYSENNIKTYRDFMSSLAQLAGGFVYADRQGSLIIKSYNNPNETVDTITAEQRITGVQFSDYNTWYAGVYYDIDNGREKGTKGPPTGTAGCVYLGNQPFLQIGQGNTDAVLQTLHQVARSIQVVPFSFSILSAACYDLGDYITAGEQISTGWGPFTCLINSINWTLKETTDLEGYGADPDLKNGKTSTDKEIESVASRVDSSEFKYYLSINPGEIELIDRTETTVGNIRFASKKNTDVEIWTELQFTVSPNNATEEQVPVYEDIEQPGADPIRSQIGYWIKETPEQIEALVKYYYDGVLVSYHPLETWQPDSDTEVATHTLHYGYLLPSVDESTAHTWEVTLELIGGSGRIFQEGAHIVLCGQGLVGDDVWDGTVTAQDATYNPVAFAALVPGRFKENTPSISAAAPQAITANDQVAPVAIGAPVPEQISEGNINIVLRNLAFNIVTEDGENNIVTEDGNANIITEVDLNNG